MMSVSHTEDRHELLVTVASLYYELNQSQQQIADRLEISRSRVSRLIAEARERRIVTIHIRKSTPRDFTLEQELISQFALKDAYVLQSTPCVEGGALVESLGRLAASYLRRVMPALPGGSWIGVAWGTSVQAAVQALPDQFRRDIDVVQLLGGVGALVIDGPDLGRMVAAKLGGRHFDLHAPALVARPDVRDTFLTEPAVREGIARARAVQLAITGIGTVQEEASSFLRAGLLSRPELTELRSLEAVGEVCGRFFDSAGRHRDFDINRRIIGIEVEDLQHIPRVLAIAHGMPKVQSILGALRGEFLTVLVIDDVTARAVLSLTGL